MKYQNKPVTIEANRFEHPATSPIGVFTRENGTAYVVTIQGQEVDVKPGEYIILEDPPGDGTRAYPCAADVFERRYQPVLD